jgi:3-oxoacyl-[acyl-carrier-protein] synthase II
MRAALSGADRAPGDVDLVVAHGTGTALNDPTESKVLDQVFRRAGARPAVTAIKGAIGHTSGASHLMSLDLALHAAEHGEIPAIAGLRQPIAEAEQLDLLLEPRHAAVRLCQINAFGFGGVNAVSLVEVLR